MAVVNGVFNIKRYTQKQGVIGPSGLEVSLHWSINSYWCCKTF